MKGAPPTRHEVLDTIDTAARCVDAKGREMDAKWGIGRLPSLVSIETGEAFWRQRRKFNAAVWEQDADNARKHGEAMLRAYDKLDALATASGASCGPPDAWEFMVGDELVILVRDRADIARVDPAGRKAQVWALDEIASVIAAQAIVVAAKTHFPGAVVESVRPASDALRVLSDSLEDIPYA